MITANEVDELEGRVLDMAVAEVVYGRDPLLARTGFEHGEPEYSWGYPMGHGRAPEYSTDVAVALEMARHMADRIFAAESDPAYIDDDDANALSLFHLGNGEYGGWAAAFLGDELLPKDWTSKCKTLKYVAIAETPALAISRAAVKLALSAVPA